jgi:hypothetical protein
MRYPRAGSRHLGGARRRPRALRRSGLMALAALALCLAAAALGAALGAANTTVTAEPIKQLSDRLETGGSQELAGLFVTGLEAGADELSWGVSSLPCRWRRYRLLATEAAISSSFSSSNEVWVTITDEQLPPSLHCGSSLPQDVHEGRATVSVLPRGASAVSRRPLSVYEDNETKVSSFVECITLAETCPGRYVLRAYLNTPRRHVVLEYAFTVTVTVAPTSRKPAGSPEGTPTTLAWVPDEALRRWPIA